MESVYNKLYVFIITLLIKVCNKLQNKVEGFIAKAANISQRCTGAGEEHIRLAFINGG